MPLSTMCPARLGRDNRRHTHCRGAGASHRVLPGPGVLPAPDVGCGQGYHAAATVFFYIPDADRTGCIPWFRARGAVVRSIWTDRWSRHPPGGSHEVADI